MRTKFLATAAALALALAGSAAAQSSPSAQQIINQLTPSGAISDTSRGIKPLAPGDAAPLVAAPGPAPAMQPPMQSAMKATMQMPATHMAQCPASANLEVDFASGSAILTPRAEATLDQLGQALNSQTLAAYDFKIVGHTDNVGDAQSNLALSAQRAAAVKAYLQAKFGVAAQRLQTEGVGAADPLVMTPPNTPDLANRRVEVINLGH